MKKSWKMLGVMVFLIVGSLFAFTGCGTKTVNLNDYLTYEVTGCNGYGKAECYIDEEGLAKEVCKKSGLKQSEDNLFFAEMYVDMIISVDCDPYEKLSNGDTVTVSWDVDEDFIKDLSDEDEESKFKVQFKYKDVTFKVKDLDKVATFDPFEDVEVVVSETAPRGYMTVTNSKYPDLEYIVENNGYLCNGDKVKVTLVDQDDDDFAYYAKENGKVPSTTEKEYTVSGLDSFVLKYTDINQDILDSVHNKANELIGKSYGVMFDNVPYDSVEYMGDIFMSMPGDPDLFTFASDYNELCVVYKTSCQGKTKYTFCKLMGIMQYKDGRQEVDIDDCSMDTKTDDAKLKGYDSLDELKKAIVREGWNIETTF